MNLILIIVLTIITLNACGSSQPCNQVSTRSATATECSTGGNAIDTWTSSTCSNKYDSTKDTNFKTVPACNSLSIKSGFSCFKADTTFAGAPNYLYTNVTYTDGSHFVECEISSSSTTSAHSVLYQSTQNGATTGGCAMTASLSGDSWGSWAYSISGSTAKVTYNCTSCPSGKGGYTYTFGSSDCVTY